MERLVLAKEIAGTREKTLGSATDFPGSTKQIQLDTKFRSNHEKSSVKMETTLRITFWTLVVTARQEEEWKVQPRTE
jgi:hypothetical protein